MGMAERTWSVPVPPSGLLVPRVRPRVLGTAGFLVKAGRGRFFLGETVVLRGAGTSVRGVVVGFSGDRVLIAPLARFMVQLSQDWVVVGTGRASSVPVGTNLLGRVVSPMGEPLDGLGSIVVRDHVPLDAPPPSPLERPLISEPLVTGIRAIDALLTMGKGQRMGLFAGSGVGKTTLLGMLARMRADVVVLCLVGERGREVREMVERVLPQEQRQRVVTVVSASSDPPILRAQAPLAATAIAEWFADQGRDVLLLVDSITRYARALREVALSVGELPARRGYPPSVFSTLPMLVERAGPRACGSITGVYTVLVEGGDMEEPIADEVRGLLDGHVVLSRRLAESGHYPAMDVPASVSRVFDEVTSPEHASSARILRRAIAVLRETETSRRMGAYVRGQDPFLDRAVDLEANIREFLQQDREPVAWESTLSRLHDLAERLGNATLR